MCTTRQSLNSFPWYTFGPVQSMGSWVASDTVFLNVPTVSWWQWHLFTITNVSAPATPGGHRQVVLHMKKYNSWTKVRHKKT